MIPRISYQQTLERALRRAPIVALIGPRQWKNHTRPPVPVSGAH